MFYFQKKIIIFNPLEQFEINSIFWCYSDFLTTKIEFYTEFNNSYFLYNQKDLNYYNLNNLLDNDYFFHYLIIKKKITWYIITMEEIIPDWWFPKYHPQIDLLLLYKPFKYLFFNLLPRSDFFFIYQLLIFFFFFFLYQNNFFFFNIITSPIKFIFFTIINFLLNTIKNMNNNLIKYSPYLITLFIIILLLNILGLIPFVKSLTSTLSITFFFSISGFLGLNIQGALIHKLYFFDKFAPNGVPFLILPGLVIIELISYFMRPISLAIRLFANMLAGHILIKLFITFCLDLSGVSIILFFGCFCFICILMSLEVFISFLQAYIFTLLILLYLNDVLNNQH